MFSHFAQLLVIPWTVACQASLPFTISWSSLRLMSIESVIPSNHLILCCPLVLLPSIFPSIRGFSSDLALCIRWPKYWSFSFHWCAINIHWLKIFRNVKTSNNMNISLFLFLMGHFGCLIWLLGVWSTGQQQWHRLELVRNAGYQPPSDTESESAFWQDLQVIHMHVTWSTTGLQFKQDGSSLVEMSELIPLTSYNRGLARTLLQG